MKTNMATMELPMITGNHSKNGWQGSILTTRHGIGSYLICWTRRMSNMNRICTYKRRIDRCKSSQQLSCRIAILTLSSFLISNRRSLHSCLKMKHSKLASRTMLLKATWNKFVDAQCLWSVGRLVDMLNFWKRVIGWQVTGRFR